jgi:putative ABC transport system permease protein
MFKSFLKAALRNLLRQKSQAIINILGLAIGLAGCLLIAGYIINELSFEDIHVNRDRIYRIDGIYATGENQIPTATIMPPLGPYMKEHYPEVENAAVFRWFYNIDMEINHEKFLGNKIFLAGPEFFEVFTIPLLAGNPAEDLVQPFTAYINEKVAKKYFGDSDPVGQTVRVMDQIDCRIAGVLEDIPGNTQLKSDFVFSYVSLAQMGMDIESWDQFGNDKDYVYLLLAEGADVAGLQEQIPLILGKHMEPETAGRYHLRLTPLKRVYLHSELNWELPPSGNLTYIYVFLVIAVVLLIIACINFINLSTARTARRFKEVGMRKVMGALRRHMVFQFLGESILTVFIAMIVGLVLFELARHELESFIGKEIELNLFTNFKFLGSILIMIVAVGVISGSYSAFYLARYNPLGILQRGRMHGKSKSLFRRALVIIQFTIAIALIFITVVIYKQLDFFNSRDKGFDSENVVILRYEDEEDAFQKLDLLKKEISQNNLCRSATLVYSAPGEDFMWLQYFTPETHADQPPGLFQIIPTDSDYLATFGLELAAGTNFKETDNSSESFKIIINERTVEEYQIENPIGYRFLSGKNTYEVIGVVRDFNTLPLDKPLMNLILIGSPYSPREIALKLEPENLSGRIAGIRQVWERMLPEQPFEYVFHEELIKNQYEDESKIGKLFSIFSFLAVFIACLGIFGLVSFSAEQRTKEIGIRKVLGSTVMGIIHLLSRELMLLVLLANLIAWPVAWYLANNWLMQFPYRTGLSWYLYALAGLLAFLIALISAGFQAVKAALTNPADSLRHE